jgi:hypothetical protein
VNRTDTINESKAAKQKCCQGEQWHLTCELVAYLKLTAQFSKQTLHCHGEREGGGRGTGQSDERWLSIRLQPSKTWNTTRATVTQKARLHVPSFTSKHSSTNLLDVTEIAVTNTEYGASYVNTVRSWIRWVWHAGPKRNMQADRPFLETHTTKRGRIQVCRIDLLVPLKHLRHQHAGRKRLWNVCKFLHVDYTALQPIRQPSSYSPPWEPEISLSNNNACSMYHNNCNLWYRHDVKLPLCFIKQRAKHTYAR